MARLVAVDVETAQSYDHLIEIGMVEIVDGRLTGREYVRRVRPASAMSPRTQAVHGISLDDLRTEPAFAEIVGHVIDFVGDATILAHNESAERITLGKEFARLGLDAWGKERFACTMKAARARGMSGKLREMCEAVGIGTGHLPAKHGALDDARLCAALHLHLEGPPALSLPREAAKVGDARPAMLDPIQRDIVARARSEAVRASGASGTGKTRLANALASDAASRGLSCLLVGADTDLDAETPVAVPPAIDPILAARHVAPAAPAGLPDWATDEVSLRAALAPAAATQARALAGRFRELRAAVPATDAEITAAASRRAPSQRTVGLLRIACRDAVTVADVLWNGNARPGRTLGDVAAAMRRDAAVTPVSDDGTLVLGDQEAFEARIAGIERAAEDAQEDRAHLGELRAALDPWAWGVAQATVSALHGSLERRRDAFGEAAAALARHKTVAAAIASGPGANARRALENFRRGYPTVDAGAAHRRIVGYARSERERAEALAPFLARSGQARLADIRALVPDAPDGVRDLGRAVALREARDAHARLAEAFAELRRSLQRPVVDAIKARPLDDLADGIAFAEAETPRVRAIRELSGLRVAFNRHGFGDLLSAGPGFEVSLDAARPLDAAPGPSEFSPRVLDLLLGTPAPATAVPRPWDGRIDRLPPGAAPPAGRRWDVIVVDDADALSPRDLGRLADAAGRLHLVGVAPGDAVELEYPHRAMCPILANAGRERATERTGSPFGAGIVVRTLTPGTDPAAALAAAAEACAAGGASHVDASAGGTGEADVALISGTHVPAEAVLAAAARARKAVVVLAESCGWKPPPPVTPTLPPPDERGLAAGGWTLDRVVEDGRVYRNGPRLALVADEPDAFGLHPETTAERVARLSGTGWAPVVAWRGSPRGAADMMALVERSAVTPDRGLRQALEAFPLPVPAATPPRRPQADAPALRFEDIPDSPHDSGSFEDVVWRLKWIREERLLRANPSMEACLLNDERISHLVRLGVDDEDAWKGKFHSVLRIGLDPRQMQAREVVFDVVAAMPRRGISTVTREMVEAVAYAVPAKAAAPAEPRAATSARPRQAVQPTATVRPAPARPQPRQSAMAFVPRSLEIVEGPRTLM